MKILVELPTWLGDTVMVTPAIENLLNFFNDSEIIIIGSIVAIEALKNHPKVTKSYVLDKNYLSLFKTIKGLGEFDFFLSFRGSIRSKFIKFFISSKKKYQFNKYKYKKGHQVEKYNNFVNDLCNLISNPGELILPVQKKIKDTKKKILGINPGATYGNAKRWYPKEFADIAIDLSSNYDVIIFGGEGEKDIALDIEMYLIEKGVSNYKNLCGKTSISELFSHISNLDLFVTGDSGPMHIAAAYKIPTVSIFGPTNDVETSQWMNEKSVIVKKNLDCQPCMKRVCPLKHHKCMKLVKASDVLRETKRFT